jgi:hypothetical protein
MHACVPPIGGIASWCAGGTGRALIVVGLGDEPESIERFAGFVGHRDPPFRLGRRQAVDDLLDEIGADIGARPPRRVVIVQVGLNGRGI